MMRSIRPALAILLTVYTVVMSVVLVMGGDAGGESGAEWLYMLPVLSATTMGLFLSVRRPDNSIGILISLTGVALITNGVVTMLIPRAFASGADVTTVLLVLTGDLAWMVQFVSSLVLLPLWFPTGTAINTRWAWVGRVAIVCSAIAMINFIFADSVCVLYESPSSSVCVETVSIPWAIDGFPDLEPLLIVGMLMAVPAIISVFVRLRRSSLEEREQLKWVLLALSLVAIGLILSFDIWGLPRWLNDTVNAVTLAGVWVAIGVAILKYKLYDIDRIISRTLSYALVLGVLGLVILGLVALLAVFLPSDDPLAVAIATLAAAALFNPVRRRIHALVDRRFNRSRYDAERVLNGFAGSLRDRVDPDDVVTGWVDVVTNTMEPSAVGVWVKSR